MTFPGLFSGCKVARISLFSVTIMSVPALPLRIGGKEASEPGCRREGVHGLFARNVDGTGLAVCSGTVTTRRPGPQGEGQAGSALPAHA